MLSFVSATSAAPVSRANPCSLADEASGCSSSQVKQRGIGGSGQTMSFAPSSTAYGPGPGAQ
jgi:hypothetical protein